MKLRFPLRNLLVLPLVALTMLSGMVSPISVAQADPISQDSDASADAATARGLSSMRLRKSNGVYVNVTVEMQRNAAILIDTVQTADWPGLSSSDRDRLTIIALMTMAQESTFYTHPYAHLPDRNNDVGPFQQRSLVGWYADGNTRAENIRILNDIRYATRTFVEGHRVTKKVAGAAGPVGYIIPGVFQMKNWRTDALWKVAANVQRPAAKYRYYYEYWRPVAEAMFTALEGYSPVTAKHVDVYTTAGEHTVNGRKWRTECETYSSSIDRCEAKIWSTQVAKVNGKFVPSNNWNFNNLTYLPSSRAEWEGNPLAIHNDKGFTSKGRQWKTSCGDEWTGPDACRSFIRSHEIESYLDKAGNRQYREVEKWVFNNIVKFSD